MVRRILLISLIVVALACGTAQAQPEATQGSTPPTLPPTSTQDVALNKCITALAYLSLRHTHEFREGRSAVVPGEVRYPRTRLTNDSLSDFVDDVCGPYLDQETVDALR